IVNDNDIRLCARSALDIISSLHKRNALLKTTQGIALDVRIGMHTGLVTCHGDAIPEGDTANIAMQLSRLADKGQILCSNTSQKILQTYIKFKQEKSAILGVNRQEEALFYVIAERQVEAFGFLRGTQNNHNFIGREQEFKQLNELFNNNSLANASANKLVHIYGEAGIGKSRLIFELRNNTRQAVHYVAQCLPEHQNNALYPILNIIKYKYSLDALGSKGAVQKLRNELMLFDHVEEDDALPILCSWLGLPLPEKMSPTALNPDQQKQVLFATLIALLISKNTRGRQQTNLFILEDMHWSDPISIELVASLSSNKHFIAAKLLFISTSRQPLPELLNECKFQLLNLAKLTQENTRKFVINLFDKQNVSDNLLDVIVTRADGIPLFVEELVNMLKQKGLVHKFNGIIDFISPDKLDEVPNSLRDSLQQKLDILIYAKETVQLAAAIGREFDYDLLIAASKSSEEQVQNNLYELIDAGLIYQQRKVSGDNYIFKHALVRDAAYDSLTKENRMKVHSQVADAMQKQSGILPILIAEHLAKAQRYDEAVVLGLSSAQTALAQSLSQTAFDIANKTIAWNKLRDDSADKFEALLRLLAVTLPAIMTVQGMGSTQVGEEIKRCESAIEKLKNLPHGLLSKAQIELERRSKFALVCYYNTRSMRVKARLLAEELLDEAIKAGDIEFEIVVRSNLGQNYYMEGYYLQAKNVLETAIALYKPEIHRDLAVKYSVEPESYCRMTLALVLWKLGYADQAVSMAKSAHHKALALGHLASVGMANVYLGLISYFRGEPEVLIDVATANTELCQKYPDMAWTTLFLKCLEEWANQKTAHTEAFIAQKRQANELFAMAFYEATLAETKIKLGHIDEALELLQNSIEWCHKTGETIALSTLYRMQAKAYLKSSSYDSADAIAALQHSITIAKQQGSIALELDACLDLCHIFNQKNQKIKVLALLSPLLKQFNEGFATKVYREAQQLLANCSQYAK
ncbi:MAG: AAA family ATPase, partial [Psychromonas sp.]|nr:AAA family ATPase [Psychromonas sp.]